MARLIKALMPPVLLVVSANCAAAASAPTGHYVEHTCIFGKYGPVTVHQGGIGRTYIVVRGKRYPSTGGENFVQSDDDDSVAVMFDRKGKLSYQGEILGKNCRITRR